ncbi:MAG: SMC-Scp complex subunit ScpB [bacterium]|nr:SMC-Scp complex subunit ScpB [bacterium]
MAKPVNLINLEQVLESLLFAYGESISVKKLAEVTSASSNNVVLALENLKTNLENRGIKLINKEDKWQLVSGKEASEYIEKLVKSEIQEELTPASLEVLAVVAYRGPVSKSEVEVLRGVNSAYALRNLTLRGLVDKNDSAKPQTYQISLGALKKLGLAQEHELPKYNELKAETLKTEKLLQN